MNRVFRRTIDRHARSVVGVNVTTPMFALTFDDGPHPVDTVAILGVLGERDIHATFFMLADRAMAAPDVVGQVIAGGHEIGLHSRTHCDLTKASLRRLWRELRGGRQTL